MQLRLFLVTGCVVCFQPFHVQRAVDTREEMILFLPDREITVLVGAGCERRTDQARVASAYLLPVRGTLFLTSHRRYFTQQS